MIAVLQVMDLQCQIIELVANIALLPIRRAMGIQKILFSSFAEIS